MEAIITLEYGDEKTAEAVANAVSPDNFKTPAGLFIRTFRSSNKVSQRLELKKNSLLLLQQLTIYYSVLLQQKM